MRLTLLSALLLLFVSCQKGTNETALVELQNPIIPGYFADPSVVEYDGKYYMYATADPWGAEFLSCWVSDDFQNWTFNQLNWPTKQACTSPTSNGNMVWAPSVIRKGDHFYMYISVGSEVWTGKASHPLGPWENMLIDQPLVPYDTTMYSHEIDAEVFIDDDNRAYLYWGSGWNWINGRLWVVELNEDMSTFKTEKKEITPERYFEAPWMIKHDGKYFLTYSEGKTIEDTYEVRYAVGDNPFGPFTQAVNSPILTKNDSLQVYGPGHHTIVNLKGQNYILYHKHRLPFEPGNAFRQITMNPLHFDDVNGQIHNITPEHTVEIPVLSDKKAACLEVLSVEASSSASEHRQPENLLDRHYGTLWETAAEDRSPVLTASFEKTTHVNTLGLRFEYPWKQYFFTVESSTDGQSWEPIADYSTEGISGSPVVVPLGHKLQQLRLRFVDKAEAATPALFELYFE